MSQSRAKSKACVMEKKREVNFSAGGLNKKV